MLREQFVKEMLRKMCIDSILEEDFIRRNKDDLPWTIISRYQPLSINFIREFKDYINWNEIRFNGKIKINKNFIREFENIFS